MTSRRAVVFLIIVTTSTGARDQQHVQYFAACMFISFLVGLR